MNDVERLHADLMERLPDRRVEVDPSFTETGSWFVTVFRDGSLRPVVVEWRPENGFGVSTPGPEDFGPGVDEAYPDAHSTLDRVVRLVLSGNSTVPPLSFCLMDVRQPEGQ